MSGGGLRRFGNLRRLASSSRGRAAIIGILLALALAPLPFLPAWQLVELRVFDLLSTLDPAVPDRPGAVIVAIDEPSFAEIDRQWPWPRDLHGRLAEALREAGARIVAFDMVFAEPSDPAADRLSPKRWVPTACWRRTRPSSRCRRASRPSEPTHYAS